uniref:Uncharacterized protein n=1 Tax=Leptocylindrus danicus TaxID=163516 RepID=A0A7S2P1M5_9STRA|mmetsp:Transcript_20832/g.31043  ORF Transcript_20832/g.31043 Transcript_20832/m.31043 type:complete len:4187 (+) Transcript_20832:137-12697(+)
MSHRVRKKPPFLLSKKTQGVDPASIDVENICPDRPLPAWIVERRRNRVKESHEKRKSRGRGFDLQGRVERVDDSSRRNEKRIRKVYKASEEKRDHKSCSDCESRFDKVRDGSLINHHSIDDELYLRLDQSKLPPLDFFDIVNQGDEEDLSPQEWIESGSGASAAIFNGDSWNWVPVSMDFYCDESKKYRVSFSDCQLSKYVSRLNLLFDIEDRSAWDLRRNKAMASRRRYISSIRFDHFVSSQSNSDVLEISDGTIERLEKNVAATLPRQFDSPVCLRKNDHKFLRSIIGEIGEDYKLSMKLSIVRDKLVTIEEFEVKHRSFGLPSPSAIKEPKKQHGKHIVPTYPFTDRKFCVGHTHPYSTFEIFQVFKWLNKAWISQLSLTSLLNVSLEELSFPCRVKDFKEWQDKHIQHTFQTLRSDWRQSFSERLTDAVGELYDFFQSSLQTYSASNLSRLLKLADIIMAQQLRSALCQAMESFSLFISKYYNDDRPSALFFSTLILSNGKFVLEPAEEDIRETLINCVDYVVSSVRSFRTIDADVMSLLRLPRRPILNVADDDPTVESCNEAIGDCKKLISLYVSKVSEYSKSLIEKYNAFCYLLDIDETIFVESKLQRVLEDVTILQNQEDDSEGYNFQDSGKDYDSLIAEVHRLHAVCDEISSIDEESERTLLRIDTTNVGVILLAKATSLRNALLNKIIDDAREMAQEIAGEFEEMLEVLMTCATDENEFAASRGYIDEFKQRVGELAVYSCSIHYRLSSLERFSYRIDFEDLSLFWGILSYPNKVEKAIESSLLRLEDEKLQLIAVLAEEKELFHSRIHCFEVQLEEVQRLDDYACMETNSEKVNGLMDSITKAESQSKNFNKRENILGLETSEYSVLSSYKERLLKFCDLWNMSVDFNSAEQEWLDGSLFELEAPIVESKVEHWLQSARDLSKEFKSYFPWAAECANQLFVETSSFRKNMPVIRALASNALKERHWIDISNMMHATIDFDDELSLRYLLDVGVIAKMDEISVVCAAAEKEHGLETSLGAMKAEWNLVEFSMRNYKDTGTFVVGGVDNIMALLDDHIVKTQTMRGSPFIKPIESTCKKWEEKLKYSLSLIEEMIACQKNWMYLEPIFSSDDIKKQLPSESKRFQGVNSLWRKIMRDCSINPKFMVHAKEEKGLDEKFIQSNKKLEDIMKGLADYLETKRLCFPRFFFLSNDELIEILSQTKDPRAVQPHLNKCFEGINRVYLEKDMKISRMTSSEGETVDLCCSIDPISSENKGKVEQWLLELQHVQWSTLYKLSRESLEEYTQTDRCDWALRWPAQVVLAISQIYWTEKQEHALNTSGYEGIRKELDIQNRQLRDIVQLVRGKISKLDRKTLGALTTIDVHARDTCAQLVAGKIQSSDDFGWISQVRYYWQESWKDGQAIKEGDDTIVVKVINARALYGYEYLGNTSRLVITPLTDRCYHTLLCAIDLLYGGAPEGPAGTGKTETVKDLSKAVAIQCVVFNCSDGLDYLAMAKFFKGLAACGAWCCFDEFNRINIEVLSVIAQQILTITQAKREGLSKFQFAGSTLPLNHNANVFITMNPGYAGRAELPDNLKALFRPCSMMVPDYALIAEIRLYSFGFEVARSNAQKLVKTLQLCSEQCSSQKHYDYGMRAVNSILVAAGNLREELSEDPQWDETKIILRAINDVNLAKFTVQDLPLFEGITNDLFPGIELPESDYGELISAIEECCNHGVTVAPNRVFKLEPRPAFLRKVIELYEMVCVRHGLCVVGETFSGKTSSIHALAEAMTLCSKRGSSFMKKTDIFTMNPKSVTSGELYGSFDENTHEWKDGILAVIYRDAAKDPSTDRKWLLFDGPVDAIWIENMNTVLDDNKKLCLMSGEIIKMTESMTMMFETEDLEQASPATVSRLGIVFTESKNIGWHVLRKTWIVGLSDRFAAFSSTGSNGPKVHLSGLFDWLFPPAIFFVEKFCVVPTPVTTMECCFSLIRLLECLLVALTREESCVSVTNEQIEGLFVLALVWSVGAAIDEKGREEFNEFVQMLMRNNYDELSLSREYDEFVLKTPGYKESLPCKISGIFIDSDEINCSIYDFFFDAQNTRWIHWTKVSKLEYTIPDNASFQSIVVPTIDTVRHDWLLGQLISNNFNALVTGNTGTGKSVTVKKMLETGLDATKYSNIIMNFSARTTASQTQDLIDSKLLKRRKGVFGPEVGLRCVVFIDDLNMPAKEDYGAQPPIEILRQWMDHAGWYNRKENVYQQLVDIQFIGAMAPPGGGRTHITQRYMRHFNVFNFLPFSNDSLEHVFSVIIDWFLVKGFSDEVKDVAQPLVSGTVNVYNKVSAALLPTPAKSHYTFNLRDVSKVFAGIIRGDSVCIQNKESIVRLWAHEVYRIFFDRLVHAQDQIWFDKMIRAEVEESFGVTWNEIVGSKKELMFGSFANPNSEVKQAYSQIEDISVARDFMSTCLHEYNETSSCPMQLVLFDYAVRHVARVSRIITAPNGGHALLVGLGGSGRKSVCALASYIAGFDLFQVEIGQSYGLADWREDLRKIFNITGVENKPLVFLFDETQIFDEAVLEDISGILNTGEVQNLFNAEETTMMIEALSLTAISAGITPGSPSEMYYFFIQRCRANLRVVLAMSPVGDNFRTRLRLFPALVNCCTINWFMDWPDEALQSVAEKCIGSIALPHQVKEGVIHCCVNMQKEVSKMTRQYKAELGRSFYVTPTSYLMMINTFRKLLFEQRSGVQEKKLRYDNGLTKIEETQVQVDVMKRNLVELRPKLDKANADTDKLLDKIAEDTKVANDSKGALEIEEAACNEQAATASALASDCEADLAEAMPALESAIKALKSLSKGDIVEVKSMKKPPEAVKMVMAAVCILMDVKPALIKDPDSGKKVKDYWSVSSKFLLGDSRFLQNLENYDKENMDDKMIREVREFTSNPAFDPETVKKGSVAAAGLCKWVHAMVIYHKVSKEVGPKKAALTEAQEQLQAAQELLTGKQLQLKELLRKLNDLQEKLDDAEEKKRNLEDQVTDCSNKLKRAAQLISGLGGEQDRWKKLSSSLAIMYENVTGDILLCSGMIAYLGSFTSSYRANAINSWSSLLQSKGITCSNDFSLSDTLGNQVVIRDWTINKLPNDLFSIDNAIMLNQSELWPLMIDPQLQATRWVKNIESANQLKVVKLNQGSFIRTIENAIQFGLPVLIENVGETLDPVLDPILLKQIVSSNGLPTIKLGDNTIEYDPKFRIYISTTLSNPHYSPEVCVKVNLLNFMATPEGLEDQMLSVLVKAEEPELEQQREELVLEDAENKRQLQEVEDQILHLLKHSKGNILDDEVLIDTLGTSRATSNTIQDKVRIAQKTQTMINDTRQTYRPIASHASTLFFCISELACIEPMYQFSLEWFIALFQLAINSTEKSTGATSHLQESFQYLLYTNVCNSLFAKDKILFSFLLCMKIMLSQGSVTQSDLRMLLQGSSALELSEPNPANEENSWLSDKIWKDLIALGECNGEFSGFHEEVASYLDRWGVVYNSPSPMKALSSIVGDRHNEFHKLMILRCIRPDAIVPAVTSHIELTLGREYIEAPQFDLASSFADSTNRTPLIFVLTPGADPMPPLLKLAGDMNFRDKIVSISLGQGQGPAAEQAIHEGMRRGKWICLQNCHLCVSWMPTLERLCEELANGDVHEKFRLWLSSEPCKAFPVSVLQNGIKMTIEPPRGIRANLIGSYSSIDSAFIESSNKPAEFKKMLFALCFFHASVRERKRFGPLGWNNSYVFSGPDLKISMDQLRVFVDESNDIPFEALHYLTAECNYGGRVTDDKDRRLLANTLDDFYCPKMLDNDYAFSTSGTYYAPAESDLASYMKYIESLPLNEGPEMFGLHQNANISCALSETNLLLSTALSLQPRSAGNEGQSWAEKVDEMASDIEKKLPSNFDMEKALLDFPVRYEESMNTVLTQELLRFNTLISTMRESLKQLKQAIQGLVVMNSDLEEMGESIVLAQVPRIWKVVSFPSLKPLGSWVNDLLERLAFLQDWLKDRQAPNIYWISGFFFTQAFITGTLQNYARKYNFSIDTVDFDFRVLTHEEMKVAEDDPPEDGAYIRGLYLDGARWDNTKHSLAESKPRELFATCPCIHLLPKLKDGIKKVKGKPQLYTGYLEGTSHVYQCPVYKTSSRWGTLSTTGHSTNFIMFINLPMDPQHDQKHWIKRGVALLTQLDD